MKKNLSSLLFATLPVLLLLLAGCGTSKTPLSEAEWRAVENVITSRDFTFVASSMEPTTGRVRNIVDDAGFFKMQGDQVQMELRYVGQRQVTQAYGRNEGMRFEGTATDITSRKNEQRNYYDLDFKLKNKAEVLQCNLRFLSARNAVLTINSNQRSSIRYQGEVKR